MDYIATLDFIDTDNVAIAGHSRLGICSLLAGAFDERFKYIISNCSGASGTSLSRGTNGEKIENITASHPYLFSTAYRKYAANEYALPFDQHALLSLCTPRHLLIGSAELDFLSDPTGEFLSLLLVNGAYRLYGKAGLIHKNVIPEANTILGEGDSLYHIRHGVRYFSREDWNVYMDFIIKKMNENKRGI